MSGISDAHGLASFIAYRKVLGMIAAAVQGVGGSKSGLKVAEAAR
jgi:hypothetical protein